MSEHTMNFPVRPMAQGIALKQWKNDRYLSRYSHVLDERFHTEYHDLVTILIPPSSVVKSAGGSQRGTYQRLSSLPVLDYQEISVLYKKTIDKLTVTA